MYLRKQVLLFKITVLYFKGGMMSLFTKCRTCCFCVCPFKGELRSILTLRARLLFFFVHLECCQYRQKQQKSVLPTPCYHLFKNRTLALQKKSLALHHLGFLSNIYMYMYPYVWLSF